MSAERVDGASTRAGTETARVVPPRAGTQRFWVIAKDGFGRPDLLTVDLDGTGQALPVFSFKEEAEMFLWLQTTEDGREVREATPEQLVSILYGPCADVGRVMLDPLPEIRARMQNSLLGMDRNDFVESVMGARSLNTPYKPSSRTLTQYLRGTLEPFKLALEAHQRSLEELERALIEFDEALSGREERPQRPLAGPTTRSSPKRI
jgi:hypothetical protein